MLDWAASYCTDFFSATVVMNSWQAAPQLHLLIAAFHALGINWRHVEEEVD